MMCRREMMENEKHGLRFLLKSSSNWGETLFVIQSLYGLFYGQFGDSGSPT